jgi:ABC-type Zn2+ transport system substrate-binding protein/surface adhesin
MLSILSFIVYSILNSKKISAHVLLNTNLHSFIFLSQINDHQEDHAHTHRHSEKDEEHSHHHLNMISSSEIVINDVNYDVYCPYEIISKIFLDYSLKSYDSYILEVLKPPIYS